MAAIAAMLVTAAPGVRADVDKDEVYENIDTHTPIAPTLDAASNLRTQERMRSLAGEPRLLVAGHDPAVFARFPKVSERIVRIE